MAKKMNWRADLQKIRNNREKADNAAKRAEEKAKKLAQRQEEAENMGILYVVRSMRLTPEELDAYYDRVAEAVKSGKSVAEADPDHLVLASKQGTPKELEGEKQWLDEYGEALHEAQAAYYDETPKEVQGPAWQKEMTPEEKIVSQGGMSFEEWKTATPSVSSADNLRRFASSESATGGDDAGTSLEEGGKRWSKAPFSPESTAGGSRKHVSQRRKGRKRGERKIL